MKEKLMVMVQHQLTESQMEELEGLGYGEIHFLKDLKPELFSKLANCPAGQWECLKIAKELIGECASYDWVRPIGSPAFNAVLDRCLFETNITSWFAHSERVSVDEPQADGSTVKKSVFRHIKFFKVNI